MIRQEKEHSQKRLTSGKLIGLVVIALLTAPEILGGLLGFALILSPVLIPLIIYFLRKKHKKEHQSALEDTTYTTCRREKAFEAERQKHFCFHDDKAIHHVGRGKEVDPWDRPDIDISKYQRKG